MVEAASLVLGMAVVVGVGCLLAAAILDARARKRDERRLLLLLARRMAFLSWTHGATGVTYDQYVREDELSRLIAVMEEREKP